MPQTHHSFIPAYGPDYDQVKMNFSEGTFIKSLQLVPKKEYVFSFTSDAAWENAVCLNGTDFGSSDRDYFFWEVVFSPVPNNGRDMNIFAYMPQRANEVLQISGWHKMGGPSGALPWVQSRMRIITEQESLVMVGFEDGADEDYDDMFVRVIVL